MYRIKPVTRPAVVWATAVVIWGRESKTKMTEEFTSNPVRLPDDVLIDTGNYLQARPEGLTDRDIADRQRVDATLAPLESELRTVDGIFARS